jgi:hypothetical protein
MPAFFSPRTVRFVIVLSAAVLLLCHGAFGALHLIPAPVLQQDLTGEHTTMHHPSGARDSTPEELPAPHHAVSEYFAVLLGTFLGGLAFWLLFLNHRRRDGTSSVRRFVASPPATVTNLPRGPTLPFLQVLRL